MENNLIVRVFFSVIGIIIVVIGWVIVSQNNTNRRIDAVESDVANIRVDTGEIRTDMGWVKGALVDLKDLTRNLTYKNGQ